MAATYTAGQVRLEVIPDMSRFGARLRAEARGLNETVKVGVEVDATSLRGLQRQINGIRGNTVRVNTDVDTSGLSRLSSLASGAAGNVGLITAAAVLAGAALAVLPGLIAGAAGGIGVLALSLKGVGDALQGYEADQDAAAKGAATLAKQTTASARAIRNAKESVDQARKSEARTAQQGAQAVVSAERRVVDAVAAEKRAQEDVTRARKAASLAAEDLRSRVAHLALDQESATLRVQEAQATLEQVNRTAGATDRDKLQASLDLKNALLDQSDLQREAARSQDELNSINQNGIDSTDGVKSALERQASAADNTRDAQAALIQTQADAAQANQDAAARVTEALRGVAEAQQSAAESAAVASAGSSQFADAMAKLSPPAQELVRQLLAMKPLIDQLSATSAAAFLPGLTQMLKDSTALFPIFNGFLRDVGTIMGETARQFGQLFKSDSFQANLQATFQAALPLVQAFSDLLVPLVDTWFQLGAASAPATKGLADFIALIGGGLNDFLIALTPAMQAFGDIWRSLGSVIGNLLTVLGPVIAAFSQALAPIMTALAPVINTIVSALGSALVTALVALTPLLTKLAEIVADVGTKLAELFVKAVEALAPLLPPLVDAFIRLLDSLMPIIPIVAEFISQIIDALLPFLPQLVDIFVKLIDEALIPLLPPLLEIIKLILPDFIQLVKWLAPLIIWLADQLVEELAYGINNVVIPALQWMRDHWVSLGDIVEWVWLHVIKPAWDALVGGLNWVKDSFRTTVDWIGRIWNGLRASLAKPINFMIGTVWNNGILPAWNAIADLLPGVDPIRPLATIPEFAEGGPVTGGTPGKDSVLAKLMPGEYVIPTKLAEQMGYDNLDRIRKASLGGRAYRDEGFLAGLPGFAQGGRIAEARQFAQSQAGKPYQWGGVGNPSWDCSGFMSGIQNVLMGRNPRQRLYTTSQFGPRRGAGGMMPFGPGGGSAFTVGVQSGHMAGTLDGVNVESSSTPGVRFGNGARGTSSFPWRFFLPSVGGQFVDPGPGGGGFFDWVGQLLASIADKFTGPAHSLINAMPFDAPPQFLGLPKKLLNSLVDQATEWMKGDANNAGGGVGGVAATGPVQDQVRAVANGFGWGGGALWDALARIIQKESSWNPNAANSRSSARGLFQKMTSLNGPLEPTVAGQAQWGLNYIRSRYGDPMRALAFHNSHGWYDSGGWLPPGASAAFNGTGVPEAVLTGRQWESIQVLAAQGVRGSDGATINVFPREAQDEAAIARNVKRHLDFSGRAV